MSVPPAVSLLAVIALTCAVTIVVELGLAMLLFGIRGRHDCSVVALAQVATNPVVELGCVMLAWTPTSPPLGPAWAGMLALEVAAVAVEAWLYRSSGTFGRPLLASLVLNVASFALGCALGLLA